MTRSLRLTVAKNALANVARGTASALVALAVPPFLTRTLPPAEYGAWALVLQLAAYVGYLEFGITTAVGRFVAHSNERGDFEHRNKIVNTALAVLLGSCLLSLVLLALVILVVPRLFGKMPAGLYPDVRIALALVGGSFAVGLPASVFNGVFLGLQRYEIPAVIVAGSRVLSAVLVIAIARHGGGISAMALSMASVNLISYVIQWAICRRYVPDIRLSVKLIERAAARELAGYCLSLTVWSFSMLLISGLDLVLVGALDFPKVAFYAVAANLVTFIAGLQNAIFSAVIPSSAILHARGASEQLGRLVLDGTRYGMFLLFLTALPLLLAAGPILRVWVGSSYALRASVFLQILVFANLIRLSAVPYVVTLIGTGQQRLVILTPFLEGVANLSLSILAGYRWGAVGVAVGTLCGAIVGLGGHFFYNMPRTTSVRFSTRAYALESLLRPTLCVLPLALSWLIANRETQIPVRGLITCAAGALTLCCFWRWGLIDADRQRLRSISRHPGLLQ